jgi:lipopolysaccharide transport system permease protein
MVLCWKKCIFVSLTLIIYFFTMSIDSRNPDLIIRPKKHLFDIDFKDIWRYRDLILLMVRRDFVAQYKQTVLGPLWFVISPLINVFMFAFVFNRIAGISTEGVPAILFYLTGLTLWNYFATTLTGISNTFVSNADIFGKVYFPRLIIPISLTISSMVRFMIQLGLLATVMIIYYFNGFQFHFSRYTLVIPFLFLNTALLSLGCGIIISSLTTKYRDFQYLLGFGVQLLMYATPIIYPVSIVPKKFAWIISLNPMAPMIEAFKYGFIGVGSFNISAIVTSVCTTLVLLFVGVLLFNKVEGSFMDTV